MSGIFNGNILGSTGSLGTVGASGGCGLGADPIIPWWCWDTPTFKAAHANCLKIEDADLRSSCFSDQIKLLCDWDKDPKKKPGTSTGTKPPGTTSSTPPVTPPPSSLAPPDAEAGFMGLPKIAWFGIAGIAGLLLLRASKKK